MNFKPKFLKVVISILAGIGYFLFKYGQQIGFCARIDCLWPEGLCPGNFPSLLPQCCNDVCGIALSEFLRQLGIIVIPIVAVYVLWSFVQKKA